MLFTSKVLGLSERSYWQRLQKLKLMSLQSYSERRGLRAIVPPYCKTATAHCQTYYCQSFVFTGLKLWNRNYLPTKLTTITIKTTLKSALAKHFDQITGHPPVEGVASDDSLLDISRLKMKSGPAADTRRCSADLCLD